MTTKDWPNVDDWYGTAARRATQTYALKAPKDGSPKAFIQWMQALGHTGEFYQSDLFDEYEMACVVFGLRRETPFKRFKYALRDAGCEVWQADCRNEKSGSKGGRPMKVRVPAKSTPATAAKSNVTTATSVPTRTKANSKPIAKHIDFLIAA